MAEKSYAEKALEYNGNGKEALTELYNALPPGQKKTVLKNPKVKEWLMKFHVIEG